ncbi:cysteine sulfinic acid decarboxylase [Chironomus tepperi]|uniref:cysteine sulfinic acid decarboxylase n=1 Tax=Chironomus tepperi TaxID=113505 RepID=UPI00391EEE88
MPFNNITDEEQSEIVMTTKSNNSSEKQIHEDLNSGNSSSGVSEDEEHDYDNTIVNKIKSVQNLKMSGAESDRLLSLPSKTHEKFLRTLFDNVLDKAIFDGTKRDNKVLEWTDPEELQKKLNMDLKDEPDSDETLLKLANDTIKYSVKTGHPYFVNQLFSCVDPYGFAGQLITDALNPSVYTYEVSPVFILMEEVVLKEMRKIVGYKNGEGDGIFCPGGSAANGYSISCARYHACPDIKAKGLHNLPRLVLFTSADAHYSVKKLASFMGIGTDNVYLIRTDECGKMDMSHLESEILRAKEENALPFMVSATAGTTVLGAFDPLEKVADLCEKYKLWMHVDAAWGGGALISQKYKKLLKGIERSDSVTWNPHKMLACPQQCSTFLCRHEGILSECHSSNAAYLFQKDKFYDTKYDTGDKHIQCGRRADVYKFWYMWRAKGTKGFEKHVDQIFEKAEYFTEIIRNREGFELIAEPECTNICFWYIPKKLRNLPRDDNFNQELHKIAPKVKERMMKEGSMMITYQPLNSKPNFFRLVLQDSSLTKQDMMHFVDIIETYSEEL